VFFLLIKRARDVSKKIAHHTRTTECRAENMYGLNTR